MAIDHEDIKKSLDDLRRHPAYRVARQALRALLIIGVWLFIGVLSLAAFRQGYNEYVGSLIPTVVRTLGELFILGFSYYSVLLAFATYHRADREDFLARIESVEKPDFAAERRRLLKDRRLLLEDAVFVLVFALSGASSLFGGFDWMVLQWGVSPLLLRALLVLLFAAATLPLSIYVRTEARRHWMDLTERIRKKGQLWRSAKEKKKNAYRTRGLVGRLILLLFLYVLLGNVLPALVPVGDFIVKLGGLVFLYLPIIPLLVGLFFASYYLRAWRHRRRFLKKLRAVCDANRIRIRRCHHPYRSILRDRKVGEYELLLDTGRALYACRILAGVRKANNVYLSPEGNATRVFALHAPARRVVAVGRFSQSISTTKDSHSLELIRLEREFDYRFDPPEGAKKILLFNPVPLKVYAEGEMDNGMNVGDYLVYSGGAFLRMLERSLHGEY